MASPQDNPAQGFTVKKVVLLGIGWAVEQLWQQWQPAAAPPWLASYTSLLQQQVQQPQTNWPATIQLPYTAIAANSIGWLEQEQQQLEPHYNGFQQTRLFVPEQAETRFSEL